MAGKINIVPKESNHLNLDTTEAKPNLVVAELLDTELIGEGCLFAYRDAVKRLTATDALFVPSRARIYIQLVQSEELFRFHQYRKHFTVGEEVSLNTPKSANNCFGSHILHDIQMSRLKPGKDFQILSEPLVVFEFEFNNIESLKLTNSKRLQIPLVKQFTEPILVFTWWDIDMDYEGEIVLSCAPYWARGLPSEEDVAWRDHWMQTIYHLPAFAFADTDLEGFHHGEINAKGSISIDAFHDSFSFWYDLPADQKDSTPIDAQSDRWSCTCGLHMGISRSRLYGINNETIYSTYWNAFKSQLEKPEFAEEKALNFVYFGDEGILPLLLASHSRISQVYVHCQDSQSQQFFRKFLAANEHVQDKVSLISSATFASFLSEKEVPLNGIISELYFKNFGNLFPSMEYFELLREYQVELLDHSPSAKFLSLPRRATMKCTLVEFKEFWKSFSDVGTDVEGFDLSQYDQLISTARMNTDWPIEPQPVWEYACKPLVENAVQLFEFTLDKPGCMRQGLTTTVTFDVSHLKEQFSTSRWPEKVAVVVWMDTVLDDAANYTLSSGPQSAEPWPLDDELIWARHAHQGVAFLGKKWPSRVNASEMGLQITFTRSLDGKSLTFSTL